MQLMRAEMNSGIAGDMTIAALLDLGASKEKLVKAIESMGIDGYELVFDRKIKNNIDANNFDVILSNHDHDHHHDHDHNHDHTWSIKLNARARIGIWGICSMEFMAFSVEQLSERADSR